jgi:hypothetical protein
MTLTQLFLNIAAYQGLPLDFSESLESLYSLDFADSGLAIRDILNKRYPDGITGLESVEVEGNNIKGIFLDQISPTITKKFNFIIDADTGEVVYDQIDTGDLDFSEVDFAVKKSQTCKEGKSSACTREDNTVYCITLGKKCKSVRLAPEETAVVKEVIAKAAKAGKVTKTPKPNVVKDPKPVKEKALKEKIVKEKTKKVTTSVSTDVVADKPKSELKQDKKELPVDNGEAYLKPKQFNPFAQPDLTVDDFIKYESKLSYVSQIENATLIFADDLAIIKEARQVNAMALSNIVSKHLDAGGSIDDDFFTNLPKFKLSVKSKKEALARSEENKKKLEIVKKEIADDSITKSLEYPVVDDKQTRGYKPFMTEDEANNYTKNSFTGGLSFYHGNQGYVTDSIANEGSQPEKNDRGMLGRGTYVGGGEDVGLNYAYLAGSQNNPKLLSLKANIKNPYVGTFAELKNFRESIDERLGTGNDETFSRYLRAKGYDSIYATDLSYLITFDGKQLVTYKNENLNPDYAPTMVDGKLVTDTGETGKKMSKLTRSK